MTTSESVDAHVGFALPSLVDAHAHNLCFVVMTSGWSQSNILRKPILALATA